MLAQEAGRVGPPGGLHQAAIVAPDHVVNPNRPVGTGICDWCTYHRADDHRVRGNDAPIQPGTLIVDTVPGHHAAWSLNLLVLGTNEIRRPATSPGCRHHGALLDRGPETGRASTAVHRRPAQDGEDHLVSMRLFKVEIACINAILGCRAFGGVPPIVRFAIACNICKRLHR